MNEKKILRVASELLTHDWPKTIEEDWNFPASLSKKHIRKILREAAVMRERMRLWSISLGEALKEELDL